MYYNWKQDRSITSYGVDLLQFFKSGDSHGIGHFKKRYMKLFLFQLWLNQILWLKKMDSLKGSFLGHFFCAARSSLAKKYTFKILSFCTTTLIDHWLDKCVANDPQFESTLQHFHSILSRMEQHIFWIGNYIRGHHWKGVKIWIASFITYS